MSSVSVTISAIQEPNMPVAGTIVGAKETVTLSSIGAFTPVIKSYYF